MKVCGAEAGLQKRLCRSAQAGAVTQELLRRSCEANCYAAAEDRLAKGLAECTCNERTQNGAGSPQASLDAPERAICVCRYPRRALAGRAGEGK